MLDQQCEYLRNTHKLLRAGRKNLRLRMLSYLKSPQLEQVRRESVLKQEEALADLDISIDDWLVKLEQVSLKPSLQ